MESRLQSYDNYIYISRNWVEKWLLTHVSVIWTWKEVTEACVRCCLQKGLKEELLVYCEQSMNGANILFLKFSKCWWGRVPPGNGWRQLPWFILLWSFLGLDLGSSLLFGSEEMDRITVCTWISPGSQASYTVHIENVCVIGVHFDWRRQNWLC